MISNSWGSDRMVIIWVPQKFSWNCYPFLDPQLGIRNFECGVSHRVISVISIQQGHAILRDKLSKSFIFLRRVMIHHSQFTCQIVPVGETNIFWSSTPSRWLNQTKDPRLPWMSLVPLGGSDVCHRYPDFTPGCCCCWGLTLTYPTPSQTSENDKGMNALRKHLLHTS